jgi:hypothetical protein
MQLAGTTTAAARVERTLLSAAFDFAFDLELKERTPPAAPWKSGASAPRKAAGSRSTSSAAKDPRNLTLAVLVKGGPKLGKRQSHASLPVSSRL